MVRVDPMATAIAVGQTVNLSIKIDNVSGLAGAEIHLAFTPGVLEIVDADPGRPGVQIANGGMLQADLVAQNVADNGVGTIDFAVAQINRPGVSGSGTLAIITIKGKSVGLTPVAFRGTPVAPTGVILIDTSGASIIAAAQPGSVHVPGPVGTPVPLPTPTSGPPGKHIVRAGETLFCIGRAYQVLPWAIAQANGVQSPYRLTVGQSLTIPNAPWANIPPGPTCNRQFPGTPPPPTATPPPAGCRATYVVVAGDTLSAIARRYSVSLYTLAAKNNVFNLNRIFVGQALCIP
jgi:LysM repeat protein